MSSDLKKILIEIIKSSAIRNIENINALIWLNEEDWVNLVELARIQNISSLLYYSLKKNNITKLLPENTLSVLKTIYQKNILVNLRLKGEMIALIKETNKENIPIVLLKGSHLMNFVYPENGLRYQRDIDILAPVDKSKDMYRIASDIGYKTEKKLNDTYFDYKYKQHLEELIKDKSVVLEIHGTIIDPTRNLFIKPEYIWEHTEKVEIDKNIVYILDPVFLIIHLCIHTSYQDDLFTDIRHYYDLFIVIEKYKEKIDWLELINYSKKFNLEKGVFITLKIIESLFDINLPESINCLISKNDNKNIDNIVKIAIEAMWNYNKNIDGKIYAKYRNGLSYSSLYKVNIFNKIRIILKKIFISKDALVMRYGADVKSINILFYYLKHTYDISKKNHNIFYNNDETDKFRTHVEQLTIMNKWLVSK